MGIFQRFLNWLLNKNFLVKWLDGYKTQVAGALIGLAFILDGVVHFLPPEIAPHVVVISNALKGIAGAFGVVGGLGKIAKVEPKKTDAEVAEVA